ncbi:hypothetical protein A5742_27545 [Mycolicibacterium fortuitum]|uniref:Uncharacterized protein n=1 Tax=Mycolicibacterium fortuitum TaxID=1766 RepID=A0ABD6QLW7_MYCFO|nr:hypothetical protein A5742_27545 [Mycolicibacterium fortuitum]
MVNSPAHYTQGPPCPGCGRTIECIDVIAGRVWTIGSAMKYLWRMDLKGKPIEDLQKAIACIQHEINRRTRGRA